MATPRQIEVAQFVVDYHQKHGKVPTTREVAKHLGCSQNNAWRIMKKLKQ
jgi:DNA-binding transcriptional regulator YhcF (GntR family)